MRKLGFLVALAAIALTSCQQERDISGTKGLSKGDIAFALQDVATRAAEEAVPSMKGVTIPFAKMEGLELTLEETIADLNSAAPETRGTPVYTENFGYLYKDKLGVYTDSKGGINATYARLEEEPDEDGWTYKYRYDVNIWPNLYQFLCCRLSASEEFTYWKRPHFTIYLFRK